MRIFIIGDSLACPRENIKTEEVWVDQLMSNHKENEYYTSCFYGKCTNDIVEKELPFIAHLRPDIVIVQVGIVDCSKRVCSRRLLNFIKRIPYFRGVFHRYATKNHYKLTKHSKHYICNISDFEKNIKLLKDSLLEYGGKLIFVAIAPAGKFMIDKVYGVEQDIKAYNEIFARYVDNDVYFVNPYLDQNIDDIIQKEDGHHLTIRGNCLVYKNVSDCLDSIYNK